MVNNLLFKEGILSEDIEWIFRVYDNATSIGNIDFSILNYIQNREGSITASKSSTLINSTLNIIDIIENSNHKYKEIEKNMQHFYY